MTIASTMSLTKTKSESADEILAVVRTELRCRCCNQPGLYAFVQRLPTRDLVMLHCENRECALWAVTRDVDDWLTMPVEQWGGFQHPDWRRPTALVLPA